MQRDAGIQTFQSFADADKATREEYWRMKPEEHLAILEFLRQQTYPDADHPPRLQRVLEFVEYAPR